MKKIFLSFVSVVFCLAVTAQNGINLKLNLEKNKVYRFSSVSQQTINQTVNGNQQTVESENRNAISLKMIDVTAGFMITEIHLDTLITNTNTMGKVVNISSVNEGDIKSTELADVMSCIMNRLSKSAMYIKMDFTGKVLEIVNSKMLSDVILKDTSLIALTGPMASAVKTQIKNMVSDNSLITMIEMFTHYLPGKNVSPGDNWNMALTTNAGGMSLDITTDFKLDGIKGNNANVAAESNIKASENAGPMMAGGAAITYDDLNGLSKSTMVIDIRSGLVIENNAKTHIAGNLGVSGPGFSMQIPMDINGTAKIIALK
jgi:hypothetical protein